MHYASPKPPPEWVLTRLGWSATLGLGPEGGGKITSVGCLGRTPRAKTLSDEFMVGVVFVRFRDLGGSHLWAFSRLIEKSLRRC